MGKRLQKNIGPQSSVNITMHGPIVMPTVPCVRTQTEKIVVYHGSDDGELYDLEKDPDEFDNLWHQPDASERKMRLLKACFDSSVFTMDPMPPRLGAF